MISQQLRFRCGALGQVHGWGQGFGLCQLLYLFTYSSYVFEWMKPSDARSSLFLTSLHYIDTTADLRPRSKIEFLHL